MSRSYISNMVKSIPDSGIKDFFDLAGSMPDVLSLGIGEPDFQTPESVKEKAIESISNGLTKYTENQGMPELREAISQYVNQKFDLQYNSEDEIIVTVGASEGIDLALRSIINDGDEVLVVEPGYVSYIPCVQMSGGTVVSIPMESENGFKLTKEQLESKITSRTKALILPFPNNPTGAIMDKDDLEKIVPVLIEHDIFVISDEIYGELTYGKNHVSIGSFASMKARTLVLSGFSKAFAMTGWRLGYAMGPKEVIWAMNKIHQFVIMSAGTTSQIAALEALQSPERDSEIEAMRQEYDKRREVLVNGFCKMGLDCVEPLGAFYVYPSIKKTGMTSMEFCEKLLQEARVAVIPGDAFGACGEGYIRCSYAYSIETIQECLNRIEKFVSKFL